MPVEPTDALLITLRGLTQPPTRGELLAAADRIAAAEKRAKDATKRAVAAEGLLAGATEISMGGGWIMMRPHVLAQWSAFPYYDGLLHASPINGTTDLGTDTVVAERELRRILADREV
jgi:hypothetical protein